jgi:teichuronic acid exporter
MTAMLWSGADLFMRQGVQFVVAVILARLLSPEEFGTIALLYLFTGVASVFIDGGFSSALVHKQDASLIDESTVFWINLAMGALAALGLWSLAPWIAEFFEYPILAPLTNVLAISLAVNALGSIHLVLFSKRLDLKRPMFVSAVASIISGATAIALAMNDFGIWALAWQTIVASVMSTLLLWFVSPWRPRLVFSIAAASGMFRFGSYLMLSGLLDITYNRIYSLLIGKFYGVRDLAFYNRADNTKQIPVDLLSSALSRVAFPAFSAAAGDVEKLRRGVQSAVRVMMLINLPIMFGLIATAENVIIVLFGEVWRPAAPILEVLCIAGIFWPLHVINLSVLKAQGHSDLFFRLEIIKKLVGAAFLLAGSFYGVIGIAWSQAAFGLFGFIINAYYTDRYLEYGVIKQVRDFAGTLITAIAMAATVYWIAEACQAKVSVLLAIQVLTGAITFISLAWLVRLSGVVDLLSALGYKKKGN